MAKKKNSKNNTLISALSVILGIVAIAMIFAPSIAIKNTEQTYSGLQIVFGFTESTFLGKIEHFSFSFMNLITYLAVVMGIIFTILGALGKGSKFASFIAIVAFVVSAVLFFMQITLCAPNQEMEKIISGLGQLLGEKSSIKDSFVLAYGSIVSAVCSILAALVLTCKIFSK